MICSRNLLGCGVCMLAVALFVGCSKKEEVSTYENAPPAASGGEEDHEHEHVHEAPHGGTLVELGEHAYNAEVVLDEAQNKVTIYLLGAHAESAQPVAQPEITLKLTADGEPAEYKLAAAPQEGDPEGMASRFEIADESLVDTLEMHEGIKATFDISIDGTNYTGTFQHDEHAHEGEHAHEEGHKHAEGEK